VRGTKNGCTWPGPAEADRRGFGLFSAPRGRQRVEADIGEVREREAELANPCPLLFCSVSLCESVYDSGEEWE
jgi:hypothetical protein